MSNKCKIIFRVAGNWDCQMKEHGRMGMLLDLKDFLNDEKNK